VFFYTDEDSNLPRYFRKTDYDVNVCLSEGVHKSTSMVVLAFYYLKILPPSIRARVYLNPNFIQAPSFAKQRDNLFLESRKSFHTAINRFIRRTNERRAVGVSHVVYDDRHAMLLVFDAPHNRLEFYDPNGRAALLWGEEDQSRTLYKYFIRNRQYFAQHLQTCKIWGNVFVFQQEKASCALWSTVIGMCRMTGIERSRLPTKLQDVVDISTAVREALLKTCGFTQFSIVPFTPQNVDDVLLDCDVEPLEVDRILGLVMKHEGKPPIPIPPDVELCDDVQFQTACQEPLYIDLRDVDLDLNFTSYLSKMCRLNYVVVNVGETVPDEDRMFNLVEAMQPNATLELISTQSFDLDAERTVSLLANLLAASQQVLLKLNQATVSRMPWFWLEPQWNRLRLGRVLIKGNLKPDNYADAVGKLKQTSEQVFVELTSASDLDLIRQVGIDKFLVQPADAERAADEFPNSTVITKWLSE
jgi:hypothetical protein